jgi:hypothetical protein
MADDVSSKVVVDADTSGAKDQVSGLRGIFASFFEGLKEGAEGASTAQAKLDQSVDKAGGSITKSVFSANLLTKAFDAVLGVISSVGSAFAGFVGSSIKMNSTLETSTLQFTTLMGNADQAREHVAFLFEFAKKTPFETGPILEASRTLQTFGGTALNSEKNLTLFGDAAAATSAPIQEVSMWSGRLYAALQAGKPFGEAAQRLGELAIMTPKTRNELEALQKSGASGQEIWTKYQESLGKFTGAMEKQSHTWEGLTSSISDSINILGGRVFEPFFELAKGGLERILDLLGDKGVNAAISRFSDATGVALHIAGEAFKPMIDALFGSVKAWAALSDAASFNEKAVRGVTAVIAGVVDGFAWLVRAIATGVQAYYEFRIAGNLLLEGFGHLVEGVLKGAIAISTTMSKITFGDTKRDWEASTARMSENLNKVQTDLGGLRKDTDDYKNKSEAAGATLRGFADKLNVASANMRDHAASYKYVPPAQQEVKKSTDALITGFEDATKGTQKLTAEQKKAAAEQEKFALSLRALETEGDGAKRAIDALDGAVVEGIKYYLQRGKSVADIARVYAVADDTVKAINEDLKAEQKILDITNASALRHAGTWDETNKALIKTSVLVTEQNGTWSSMIGLMPNVKSALMLHNEEQHKAALATQAAWDSLKGLSQSMAQLAQVAPGSFAGMIGGIGQIAGAANAAHDAVGAMKSGFAALTAPGGGIGGTLSGLAGMASGVAGFASAVIAMVPVVVGAFKKLFGIKDEWQSVTDDILRDYDVKISKELAEKIAKDSKSIGDRSAAILNNLGAVIKEAGGVTVANADQWIGKANDLFVMLDRKMLTTEQVSKQLNDVFPQLAKVVSDSNDLASASFVRLIDLDDKMGTKSAEIAAFVKGQITGVIIPGLNQWTQVFLDAADQQTKIAQERTKLEDDLSHARTADEKAQIQQRLDVLKFSANDAQAIIKATSVQTQEQATGLTETVAVTFAKLRSEGMSTGDAIKALQPTILSLQTQLGEAGLTGTDAFNEIADMADLAHDQVAGPTLSAVDGLTSAMRGLHNSGLLNQTMFSALASQTTQAFQQLQAQGKNGDTVLRSMQPTLQMLWEEQQKFGRTVDASTQEMLDQAKASGIVGSQYMSAQDRMAASTEHLDSVITAMARTMGVTVPQAADEAARRTGAASDTIANKINTGPNPAVLDLQGRLNSTPWETFAGRATDAGSKAALAVQRAAYEAQTAGANVANSSSAWDTWAQRAGAAAQRVQQEVDGVSFGFSPGGIKEWVPMLKKAGDAFGDFGAKSTGHLRRVKSEVDAFSVKAGGSLDVGAQMGAAGAAPLTLNVAVDAKGALFEEDRSVRRIADRIGDAIAEKYFGGQKAGAS